MERPRGETKGRDSRRDKGKYTEERDRRPKIQKEKRGRERLEKYIKRYRGERLRGEK
jgi:hypothetical protein